MCAPSCREELLAFEALYGQGCFNYPVRISDRAGAESAWAHLSLCWERHCACPSILPLPGWRAETDAEHASSKAAKSVEEIQAVCCPPSSNCRANGAGDNESAPWYV